MLFLGTEPFPEENSNSAWKTSKVCLSCFGTNILVNIYVSCYDHFVVDLILTNSIHGLGNWDSMDLS